MMSNKSNEMVPFLVRFAKAIPHKPDPVFRYDASRQLGQVLVDGLWTDSPDAGDILNGTRVTEVKTETIDE